MRGRLNFYGKGAGRHTVEGIGAGLEVDHVSTAAPQMIVCTRFVDADGALIAERREAGASNRTCDPRAGIEREVDVRRF